MTATDRIKQGILDALESRKFDYEIANSYGERGQHSDKPILLGNWNELNESELNAVERYFEIEWSDEWIVLYDEDCKAYRTMPNSYSRGLSVTIWNGEFVSFDYIRESGQLIDYILDELTDKPLNALSTDIISEEDLLEAGAVLVEGDFESGFHDHMNVTPQKIMNQYPDRRQNMFFRVNCKSQFHIGFELWELPE